MKELFLYGTTSIDYPLASCKSMYEQDVIFYYL